MSVDAEIREVLSYNPDTGDVIWTDKAPKAVKGKVAGTPSKAGYIIVVYKGKFYKAHRIAWFLQHGAWPENMIDHIDGNPANNKIENLRDVVNMINQRNRKRAAAHSKSGLLGASSYRNKWKAQIKVDGKCVYLGLFDTAEEAHAIYMDAKNKLEKNNG